MKLVIERDKWLRGEGSEYSKLLRDDGKMCCLGFLALTCNGTEEDIKESDSPAGVNYLEWPDFLLTEGGLDSPTCSELMTVNDDEDLLDLERETRLKEIFEKEGIEVTFK